MCCAMYAMYVEDRCCFGVQMTWERLEGERWRSLRLSVFLCMGGMGCGVEWSGVGCGDGIEVEVMEESEVMRVEVAVDGE